MIVSSCCVVEELLALLDGTAEIGGAARYAIFESAEIDLSSWFLSLPLLVEEILEEAIVKIKELNRGSLSWLSAAELRSFTERVASDFNNPI
jgi:hypothetical protein